MKKYSFLNACDRFQDTPENSVLWKEMMDNKEKISSSEFISSCDMSKMLDEDEKPEIYMLESLRADDSSSAYKSEMNGKSCLFFQTAGFEFIFTEGGEHPYEAPSTLSKRKKKRKSSSP